MANVKATDLIDFTRASKGHAMAKVSYGDELVPNGTFDTDASGWNALGNSTISVSNGEMIVSGDGGYNDYAQDLITTEAGKLYSVEATGRSITGNMFLAIKLSVSPFTTLVSHTFTSTSPETVKLSFVAGGPTTQIQFIQYSGSSGSGALDKVSVKEVTFDQPDGTIQLFEHPNNIPRIEYDSDGNLLGLLLEESRTNVVPKSEDFTDSNWIKQTGTSVTANQAISPENILNADELASRGAFFIYDVFNLSASTDYAVSFYIKNKNSAKTRIWGADEVGCDIVWNGSAIESVTNGLTFEYVGNDWYRVAVTKTSESNGVFISRIYPGWQADDLQSVYLWGYQVEAGGFATSYIRSNSGSSTTRSSDIASMPIDFGYNLTEGTVTATFQRMGIQSSGNDYIVQFYEAFNQRTAIYLNSAADRTYSAQSTNQNNFNFGSPVTGQYTKIAYAFATNDFAGSQNGGTVLTDTSGTFDGTGHATVQIGNNNGGEVFTGHLKSIQYIPKRLSNAKLQELSS